MTGFTIRSLASKYFEEKMKKLYSFLIKHQSRFDKIMVACFVLGLVLVAFALAQVPAWVNPVEAEFIDHKLPQQMASVAPGINPTEEIVVSAGVDAVMESAGQQATMVKRHPLDGIDFSPSSKRITLEILLDGSQADPSASIKVPFIPGDHCEFGEGYACVYDFTSSAIKRVILVSAHSGWGGEAESLRDYLEGSGFFQAALTEDQIKDKVRSLLGSEISIQQGEIVLDGFRLIDILRVPAQYVDAYMALPVEQALDYALEVTHTDPGLLDHDLLVLETCGWKLPGEPSVAGLEYTSSAIYLVFVKLVSQ